MVHHARLGMLLSALSLVALVTACEPPLPTSLSSDITPRSAKPPASGSSVTPPSANAGAAQPVVNVREATATPSPATTTATSGSVTPTSSLPTTTPAPATTTVPPARDAGGSGSVAPLWSGDAETGNLSQFKTTPWNLVGGPAPSPVSAPVRDGRFAVKITLDRATTAKDGICCGSRNELEPKFRDIKPNDDLYFGFSSYLATGFPTSATWQVITQWKQNGDGSPPLSVNVEEGRYKLEGGFGHPSGSRLFVRDLGPAVTGVWVDWVIHVKFSADPTVGYVELWQNGTQTVGKFSPPGGTMYPNGQGTMSYLKTGYYRDSAISTPGTIYFDDWRIGSTRPSVDR